MIFPVNFDNWFLRQWMSLQPGLDTATVAITDVTYWTLVWYATICLQRRLPFHSRLDIHAVRLFITRCSYCKQFFVRQPDKVNSVFRVFATELALSVTNIISGQHWWLYTFPGRLATCRCISIVCIIVLFVYLTNIFFFFFGHVWPACWHELYMQVLCTFLFRTC